MGPPVPAATRQARYRQRQEAVIRAIAERAALLTQGRADDPPIGTLGSLTAYVSTNGRI